MFSRASSGILEFLSGTISENLGFEAFEADPNLIVPAEPTRTLWVDWLAPT